MKLRALSLLTLLCHYCSSTTLSGYGADPTKVSVSGCSSGAAMCTQFHVAYSSEVMGAGIIAGAPYYCAQGNYVDGTLCMYAPSKEDIEGLVGMTRNFSELGYVDPVSYLQGSKVYVLAGTLDTVVNPANGPNIQQYYADFGANVMTKFDLPAEHCIPSADYGKECSYFGTPYINNCDYNSAFILLNHMYGSLQGPSGSVPLRGEFYLFDQEEVMNETADDASMDTSGYVYVPSGCINNRGCKLHIAFHGCTQGRQFVDDTYVRNAGYNEVGELNDTIILYPQTVISLPSNPAGCWDWWGYTDEDYAFKTGVQMVAVHKMLERLLS